MLNLAEMLRLVDMPQRAYLLLKWMAKAVAASLLRAADACRLQPQAAPLTDRVRPPPANLPRPGCGGANRRVNPCGPFQKK